jgi:formylglycine-generating enzyme
MGRCLLIMGEHMSRNTLWGGLGAAIVGLALAGVASAGAVITIDTVPVGNAGNAADTRVMEDGTSGYGRVNYAYNIGKYEVTAGQYTAFLNAVGKSDQQSLFNSGLYHVNMAFYGGIQRSGTSGNYSYSVADDYIDRPVIDVTFFSALRFANWLQNGQPSGDLGPNTTEEGAYTINSINVTRNTGWRWAVTSEDEWYKAAYYNPATSSYYLYPTSNNEPPGRDMTDPLGNNANYNPDTYGVSPIDLPYLTTLVGEFQNSASPYGTFDQGGNAIEFNESMYYLGWRGLRGGSYFNSIGKLRADQRSLGLHPMQFSELNGFRVVQVPEPGALGLLALGAVGMLLRRRGRRWHDSCPASLDELHRTT